MPKPYLFRIGQKVSVKDSHPIQSFVIRDRNHGYKSRENVYIEHFMRSGVATHGEGELIAYRRPTAKDLLAQAKDEIGAACDTLASQAPDDWSRMFFASTAYGELERALKLLHRYRKALIRRNPGD